MYYLALFFFGGALMLLCLMAAGLAYVMWFAKPTEQLNHEGLCQGAGLVLCLVSAGATCLVIGKVAAAIVH